MSSSEQNPSLKEKTVKGVFWSAAESWGAQGTQLLTFLVLARLLGPEMFGLVSMANIFIHFVQALIGSGFSDAIVQRKDLEPEHLDTAFWANLGIGILLTGMGIASAGHIASFFSEPALASIIPWCSLNVLLNSLSSIQEAILRRNLSFKGLAVRRVGGALIGSIVGITMAFLGFGVWSLICQTLVGSFFGVVLLWSVSPWRPQLRVSSRHFNDLFSFGINVVGMGILVFLSQRGDDFLIGYFLGPVALGYYTVAYKLLIIITQLFGNTVRKVALPTFSKLQDNPERLRQAVYKATKLINFLTMPIFLGIAVLAPDVTQLLFGNQWLPSVPIMQVLAIVGVAQATVYFTNPVMNAIGRPDLSLLLLLAYTFAKLVTFFVAVQFGILAVAVALGICSYIIAPVKVLFFKRLLKINLLTYCSQYLPSLGGALMMVVAISITRFLIDPFTSIVGSLAVTITVGSVVYLGMLRLIDAKLLEDVLGLISPMLSKNRNASAEKP